VGLEGGGEEEGGLEAPPAPGHQVPDRSPPQAGEVLGVAPRLGRHLLPHLQVLFQGAHLGAPPGLEDGPLDEPSRLGQGQEGAGEHAPRRLAQEGEALGTPPEVGGHPLGEAQGEEGVQEAVVAHGHRVLFPEGGEGQKPQGPQAVVGQKDHRPLPRQPPSGVDGLGPASREEASPVEKDHDRKPLPGRRLQGKVDLDLEAVLLLGRHRPPELGREAGGLGAGPDRPLPQALHGPGGGKAPRLPVGQAVHRPHPIPGLAPEGAFRGEEEELRRQGGGEEEKEEPAHGLIIPRRWRASRRASGPRASGWPGWTRRAGGPGPGPSWWGR
jgi:hypothetical protein